MPLKARLVVLSQRTDALWAEREAQGQNGHAQDLSHICFNVLSAHTHFLMKVVSFSTKTEVFVGLSS